MNELSDISELNEEEKKSSGAKKHTEEDYSFIPGIRVIGHAFNVFGDLQISSRDLLFDLGVNEYREVTIGGKVYRVPKYVKVNEQDQYAETEDIVTESRLEFQNKFSSSMGASGTYGAFSMQFNAYFNRNISGKTKNYYSLYSEIHQDFTIELSFGEKDPSEFLTEKAKQAFEAAHESEDYDKLFNEWGTHYPNHAVLGGRCDITSLASQKSITSVLEFGAEVKAVYNAISKAAEAKGKVDYKDVSDEFMSYASWNTSCIGGDTSKAALIKVNGEALNAWRDTVQSYPDIIGFRSYKNTLEEDEIGVNSPLQEIWRLEKDDKKREVMKRHFEEYMAKMSVKFQLRGGAKWTIKEGNIHLGDKVYKSEDDLIGLYVLTLNRLTLQAAPEETIGGKKTTRQYFTWNDESEQKRLANYLNSINSDKIVIIVSYDSGWGLPGGSNILSDLIYALERCGASDLISPDLEFDWRQPFCMIGVPGDFDSGVYSLLDTGSNSPAMLDGHLMKSESDINYLIEIEL
ncbi:MAC/perforin domain-containing protein [Microbulbifer sp. VTAC004]|uniref:MAC/perforin domain-containing protein n=1 Tax=Microbulbifer sp. VTAC004 TaxID=3243386 RepID=UPI004039EF6D